MESENFSDPEKTKHSQLSLGREKIHSSTWDFIKKKEYFFLNDQEGYFFSEIL